MRRGVSQSWEIEQIQRIGTKLKARQNAISELGKKKGAFTGPGTSPATGRVEMKAPKFAIPMHVAVLESHVMERGMYPGTARE